MEKLYQYLWQHSMLGRKLILRDRREIKILNPGRLNLNAGPDFSNARLLIDKDILIGNVEIHVKASDWYRHNHDKDDAYDSVLLHVVAIEDAKVYRKDGSVIPQVCVTFPEEFYFLYASLAEQIKSIRCASRLGHLSSLVVNDWLSSLAVERIQDKGRRILEINKTFAGDWKQTCFVIFARSLGFGLNSEAFEQLARSLPLNYIARHSDNIFQIEALLFGQAGMLDSSEHQFDEYYQSLCREYLFLARKYGLKPLQRSIWKYSRTRPGNFPHRRIAMLAQYLYGGFTLMGDIIEAGGDVDKSRELFVMALDGYWETHSRFGSEERKAPAALSRNSVDLLLINLIVPLLYTYSSSIGELEKAEDTLSLLMELPTEQNMYIRQWKSYGIKCEDAMHSQALIQLSRCYCEADRCLECRFGHALLRKTVERWQ